VSAQLERCLRDIHTASQHMTVMPTSYEVWLAKCSSVPTCPGRSGDATISTRRPNASTELGMRPLVAHCHLGLGKLYRRTDKREQAQVHLTTAATMYREMGMTYWLEKAEAEMQGLK
jgi:hypothetical protein